MFLIIMNSAILILLSLSSASLYISFKQLQEMKKNKVNNDMKLNKVDCGCGCSSMQTCTKDENYDFNQNEILPEN